MNLITSVIAITHNKAERDMSMWKFNEVKINLLLPCNVRAVDYSLHSSLVIGEYLFCMKHLTNSIENMKSTNNMRSETFEIIHQCSQFHTVSKPINLKCFAKESHCYK